MLNLQEENYGNELKYGKKYISGKEISNKKVTIFPKFIFVNVPSLMKMVQWYYDFKKKNLTSYF